MKQWYPTVIIVSGIITAGLAVYDAANGGMNMTAKNPDPSHTHADFAVWVNGQKLDFSDARYMSGLSTDVVHDESHSKYLHLHDGNGHVIHRHKPGLTLADFFHSIGLEMAATCLTLDDFQYSKLDKGWVSDFARTKSLCDDGKFHWTMIVNETAMPMNAAYDFADGDKILLSYGSGDMAPMEEYGRMTDDACKYSKTCPWKGPPPTENCIADPTVPCVVP